MTCWEYQVLRFAVPDEVHFDHAKVAEALNRWGAQGWELVSTETIARQPYGTLYFIATLKRARPEGRMPG